MTIEQLLDCSAEQLEKLSDKELLEYFAPKLSVTRPELAAKERSTKAISQRNDNSSLDSKMDLAKKIAAQFGLNLDEL